MTVIAAYHGTNSFVFGADTGVDYGDCRMTTCEDKIRKEHNWIIGMAGDGSAIVKIEFHPETFKTDSIKCVTEAMHGILDDELGEDKDFLAILANTKTGEMFAMDSYLYPQAIPSGHFWAVGSGGVMALGAMAVMAMPLDRGMMDQVVEACIKYSPQCAGHPVSKVFFKA